MRIVYDDAHQEEFTKLFENFFDSIKDVSQFVEYDWGMNRVQNYLVGKAFREYVSKFDFEIGTNDIDTSGIGNNCEYPVYYVGNPNEKQQVCIYASIHGMYSEAYFNIRDYQDKCIKGVKRYEITPRGVEFH